MKHSVDVLKKFETILKEVLFISEFQYLYATFYYFTSNFNFFQLDQGVITSKDMPFHNLLTQQTPHILSQTELLFRNRNTVASSELRSKRSLVVSVRTEKKTRKPVYFYTPLYCATAVVAAKLSSTKVIA